MSTSFTTGKAQSDPLLGSTSLPVSLLDLDVTEPDTSMELAKAAKRKKKKKKSKSAATTELVPSHVSVSTIEDSSQNKPIVLSGSGDNSVLNRTENNQTESEFLPMVLSKILRQIHNSQIEKIYTHRLTIVRVMQLEMRNVNMTLLASHGGPIVIASLSTIIISPPRGHILPGTTLGDSTMEMAILSSLEA
jgi:ribonucleotide reductase alpha subunit